MKTQIINRVYFKKGELQIAFTEDEATYQATYKEAPHPDLLAALGALSQDVAEVCELPDTEHNRVTAFSISIGRKKGVRNFKISAERSLRDSKVCYTVTTPLVWASFRDVRQELSDEGLERVNALEKEARLFLSGKRAQASLFEEEADEDQDPREERMLETAAEIATRLLEGLGSVPEGGAAKVIAHLTGSVERVRGWMADGQIQPEALATVAETLTKAFHEWRAAGPKLTLKQADQLDALAADLESLSDATRYASSGDGQAQAGAEIAPPAEAAAEVEVE